MWHIKDGGAKKVRGAKQNGGVIHKKWRCIQKRSRFDTEDVNAIHTVVGVPGSRPWRHHVGSR